MTTEITDGLLYVDGNVLNLPNYKFIKFLDNGANADVFLATNTHLMRNEAIKIWKARRGFDAVDPKRVMGEVQKNAQFTNEDVATIYSFQIIDNVYCCTMEYCEGVTLAQFLAEKPTPFERWVAIRSISQAMKAVYSTNTYHGDLHSKNIIVQENIVIKLLDFGTSIFSKIKEDSHKRDARLLYRLSIEVMPELKDIPFYSDARMVNMPSPLLNQALFLSLKLCMPELPEDDKFPMPTIPIKNREIDATELSAFVIDCPVFDLTKVHKYMKQLDFADTSVGMLFSTLYNHFVDENEPIRKQMCSDRQLEVLYSCYKTAQQELISRYQ